MGAQPDTIFGLTGAGDLILTATGELSRNRRVGLQLAEGHALDSILKTLGHVAEGVYTAREVAKLATTRGVEMPVSEAVNAVLEASSRRIPRSSNCSHAIRRRSLGRAQEADLAPRFEHHDRHGVRD